MRSALVELLKPEAQFFHSPYRSHTATDSDAPIRDSQLLKINDGEAANDILLQICAAQMQDERERVAADAADDGRHFLRLLDGWSLGGAGVGGERFLSRWNFKAGRAKWHSVRPSVRPSGWLAVCMLSW